MHHPLNKRMTYTVLVDRDHTFSHFIFPPKGVKIHKKSVRHQGQTLGFLIDIINVRTAASKTQGYTASVTNN